MASSVFFKFKSQKEPQRVTFDGTGISVFELKREIINISRLGEGTDFDLNIYSEDNNEEYDDDTTIIPRSTTVIARRLPASKPGQGRAARYVSGRMPATAKNHYRTEQTNHSSASQKSSNSTSNAATAMQNAQTEEEKIAAMHQMDADQWEQQKQQMAGATPVFRPGGPKGKPTSVPDHKPPPGYICYRCHQKGHWIQACPTNNDPNFDGRPRVKRTTGIPRSMLQTVEKPAALSNDGLTDDARQPSGVMVNAEGDYVVAVPDKASWEQYQAKAQAAAARDDVAASGNKELQDRGLECPIDKRMFVNPMKTPCCGKTFCFDCIENALVNSDLVCPECSTEGVLIDNLIPDEETSDKIKVYEDEKNAEKKAQESKPDSPKETSNEKTGAADVNSPSATPAAAVDEAVSADKEQSPSENFKKRPAEEELESERKKTPVGPAAMQKSSSNSSNPSSKQQPKPSQLPPGLDQAFVDHMNALAGASGNVPNNNNMNMNMSSMPQMNNFPMASMGPMMGMPQQMMNPMMMQQMQQWGDMPAGFPQFNGMNMNMGMPNMPMAMNGMGNMNGIPNWQGMNGTGWGGDMNGMGGNFPNQPNQFSQGSQVNPPTGPRGNRVGFPNQQFNQQNNNDDDAYMRKPVNPHRHQGRQRKARPTDYREL